MKMHGIFGLFLTSLVLGHVVPYGLDAGNNSVLLERQAPQGKISSLKVSPVSVPVEGLTGSGECTTAQIDKLRTAIIPEALRMLDNAIKVLAMKNAEKSPAYKDWFGTPSSSTRNSINKHNFEAPRHDLGLRLETTTQSLTPSALDPDALTFTCWPKKDDHCRVGLIAGTINPGIHKGLEQNFKGTLIGLCPRFFELPDLKEVIRRFDKKDKTLVVTAALTIVHEMQHVLMTTGKGRVCDDHKYDAEECKKLDAKKKITNAQNMALFALDITAHPERGCLSPKEGCCWC